MCYESNSLVSTHSSGPRVILPRASSSRSFCCRKTISVMPSDDGVPKKPSSECHLLSEMSQLHDRSGSTHVLFAEHGHEPAAAEAEADPVQLETRADPVQ